MRRVAQLNFEGVTGREAESGVEDDLGTSSIVDGRRRMENFRRSSDMVVGCRPDEKDCEKVT